MSGRCLRWAVLAALLAAGAASAADSCEPTALFQRDKTLVLRPEGSGVSLRLGAVLARDTVMPLDRDLGDIQQASLPMKLPAQATVRDFTPGRDALAVGSTVTLEGDDRGSGDFIAADGELRYRVPVRDGRLQTVDGYPLQLLPITASDVPFGVARDSVVKAVTATTMTIAAGARLEWGVDDVLGLPVRLASPARLMQTEAADAGGAQLVVERPASVLGGGKMQVRLSAPNRDLQARAPVFCLYLPGADGPVMAEQVRLVKLEGSQGVYEIRVPATWEYAHGRGRAIDGLQQDDDTFVLNRRAWLRALVFDKGQVVLDVQRRFPLSRALLSVGVALGLLFLLFVMSGIFLSGWAPGEMRARRAAGPRRGRVPHAVARVFGLLGRLIQQADGRYSLSNLQILLWTVLVIFSLTYVWASTGELLVLSPGVLVLLGISGGTSVLARLLQTDGGAAPAPAAANATQPNLKDLVWSNGGFDLLRFQMLGFTLFAWLYSLVSVLRAEGLPDIPPSLYGLMGISNGAYLGGKLQQKLTSEEVTPPAPAAADAFEASLDDKRLKALQQAVGAPTTGRLDDQTREAVRRYKLQNRLVPADGTVDDLLVRRLAV